MRMIYMYECFPTRQKKTQVTKFPPFCRPFRPDFSRRSTNATTMTNCFRQRVNRVIRVTKQQRLLSAKPKFSHTKRHSSKIRSIRWLKTNCNPEKNKPKLICQNNYYRLINLSKTTIPNCND